MKEIGKESSEKDISPRPEGGPSQEVVAKNLEPSRGASSLKKKKPALAAPSLG